MVQFEDLRAWGAREEVEQDALERLWAELSARSSGDGPTGRAHPPTRSGRFDLPHVAFYAGGLVALTSMSVFMTDGWVTYGPVVGLAIAIVYALAFAGASAFSRRRGWSVPGGILATIAVALVPLIVFAFQQAFGLWHDERFSEYHDFYPWISSSWFAMEAATVVAGLATLRRVRFGLVLLPVGVSTWFMSMDLTALLFGPHPSDATRVAMTLAFGALMIGVGWLFDRVGARDLGFWPHLFGLQAVLGALCFTGADRGELWWAVFALASAGAVALSVRWSRKTYVVMGGLGLYGWLGHLAFAVFQDSLLFPPAMAAIGVATIWCGVLLSRRPAAGASPRPT